MILIEVLLIILNAYNTGAFTAIMISVVSSTNNLCILHIVRHRNDVVENVYVSSSDTSSDLFQLISLKGWRPSGR